MGNVPSGTVGNTLQLIGNVAASVDKPKDGDTSTNPADLVYAPLKKKLMDDSILCQGKDKTITVCPTVFAPIMQQAVTYGGIGVAILSVLLVGLIAVVLLR